MALTSALFTGLSGPRRQPDQAQRRRQQHRQRQHRRLQAQPGLFKPQFYVTDAGGGAARRKLRRHQPQPARPGRAGRRDREGLHPGLDRDHRQDDRHGHRRRRILHRPGRRNSNTPATARSRSIPRTSSSPPAANSSRASASTPTSTSSPGSLGNINVPLGALTGAKATENAFFKGNLNANGAASPPGRAS